MRADSPPPIPYGGEPRSDTVPELDVEPRPPPAFPEVVEIPVVFRTAETWEWDRRDLLDSSAITLADFLRDQAPGLLPLRADFYAGPHHLADGLFGAGFVRITVDGRELPPLEGGQPDLGRISLTRIERLRVTRRAGETIVEVKSLRHPGGEAYSRVDAGTGQPGADLIRGVFTNGAGDALTFVAAVDFFNIRGGPTPSQRLDAFARVSWMPFDNRSGVELIWQNESITRDALGEEGLDRNDLQLHARAELTEGVQADLWVGRGKRTPDEPEVPGFEPPPGAGEEDEMPDDPPEIRGEQAEFRIKAVEGRGSLEAGFRLMDGPGQPNLGGDARVRVAATDFLTVDGSIHFADWDEFDASGFEVGMDVRPDLGAGLEIRGSLASGTRGLPRPDTGTADSVSYDALAVSAGAEVGPYRVSGRIAHQNLSRQLPFGGAFDGAGEPGEQSETTGVEARLEGPLIPTGRIGDILRVRGFWRHQLADSGGPFRYLPSDLARGEVAYRDFFFDDNLEVRATLRLERRSGMFTSRPGEAAPEPLPVQDLSQGELVVRIDTFRIWWRVDDILQLGETDLAGLPFPTSRSVFGISWEFTN